MVLAQLVTFVIIRQQNFHSLVWEILLEQLQEEHLLPIAHPALLDFSVQWVLICHTNALEVIIAQLEVDYRQHVSLIAITSLNYRVTHLHVFFAMLQRLLEELIVMDQFLSLLSLNLMGISALLAIFVQEQ